MKRRHYVRHGLTKTPTVRAWENMLTRCENPKHNSYKNYGARGIKVCEEWHTFTNFLRDMGEKPEGLTLDRYPNNDGNYEPGNCKWATKSENNRNTRVNRIIEYGDFRACIAEWAEVLGIKRGTLECRIWRGWSAERALLTALVLIVVFIPSLARSASGTVTLSWSDNSGIVSLINCSDTAKTCDQEEFFNIYRSLNGGPLGVVATVGSNIIVATDTTPIIPFAPAPANVYCYQVTAVNHGTPTPPATVGPVQESAPTNQVCKTFQPVALVAPPAASNLTAK